MSALSKGNGMKKSQTWREAIDVITRCPVCHEQYHKENARLCGTGENASKVHLTCATCGSYALIMVITMPHGLSSVGIATDLSYADVARLENLGSVEMDECINLYELLKSNLFVDGLAGSATRK